MDYARAPDTANETFLGRLQVSVTPPETEHPALDMDLFAQDNSGTRKEVVDYRYRGFDGYGVMPD